MKQNISLTAHDLQRLRRLVAELAQRSHSMQESADALEETLDTGRIVAPQDIPGDVVTMNSQVQFEDLESGELREAAVVYPEDSNPATGNISVLSPVGIALLGLAAGDEAVLPLPHGRTACIRIRKVLWQPEANGLYAL
jgi:regulator of nucleoside diphosphate kinase